METMVRSSRGCLQGRTLAILMESDYVESELHYYQRRDLVTGRSAGHCHLFARTLIDLLAASEPRGALAMRSAR